MVGRLQNFCLKVKNTFLEVGPDKDDVPQAEGEEQWKRSESQPDWTTKKLLGSSFNFSRLADGKQSPSSFIKSDVGSFCTESINEHQEVNEPEPELQGSGMVRQETEECWVTWDGKQPIPDVVEPNAIEKTTDDVSKCTFTFEISNPEDDTDELTHCTTGGSGDNGDTHQKRMRRRRKRDSLIDKAAKQNKQPENSNASQPSSSAGQTAKPNCSAGSSVTVLERPAVDTCPQCGGDCQPSFNFCYFCGAKLR